MEATMQSRAALLATARSAAASTSAAVISLYFSTGASEMRDLGAIIAVLGADAALDIEQVVEADALAEMGMAHLVDGGDQSQQVLVGPGQDGQGLFPGQFLARQAFFRPFEGAQRSGMGRGGAAG